MKVQTYKENRGDPDFIDLDSTLEPYLKANGISELVSKEDLANVIKDVILELHKRKTLLDVFAKDGIFNLALPINIASTQEVEKTPCEEGSLYYDIIKDRLRLKGLEGWKTI